MPLPVSNGARPQHRVCRTALARAVQSAVQQGCSACGDGAAAVTPPHSADGWHGRWQQPCEVQLDCGRRAGSRSRRTAAGGASGHRLDLPMGWEGGVSGWQWLGAHAARRRSTLCGRRRRCRGHSGKSRHSRESRRRRRVRICHILFCTVVCHMSRSNTCLLYIAFKCCESLSCINTHSTRIWLSLCFRCLFK